MSRERISALNTCQARNKADIFTKGLPKETFTQSRDELNIV